MSQESQDQNGKSGSADNESAPKPGALQKLRDSFRREVEELADLELDVEDLAQRKASLLKQYLKADVDDVKHFWDDLKEEIAEWEGYFGQWVLQAADPTQLDWVRLDHYIEKGEGKLMAGEIASDQELVCVGCGKIRVAEGIVTIKPCSNCGGELYVVRERRS